MYQFCFFPKASPMLEMLGRTSKKGRKEGPDERGWTVNRGNSLGGAKRERRGWTAKHGNSLGELR